MKDCIVRTGQHKTVSEPTVQRLKAALNSGGRIQLPKGLTREQKRQFIINNR